MWNWLKAAITWQSKEQKDMKWLDEQRRKEMKKKYAHLSCKGVLILRKEEDKRKKSLTGE